MIKSHFNLAWRMLRNQWSYSLINISGLAAAMVCCIFILLYIYDERSYDRYHADADRIYRIARDMVNNEGQREPNARTYRPMAFALRTELPEVEAATALVPIRETVMRYGDRQFYEARIFEADRHLFEVFTFPFLQGNPEDVLRTPEAMMITESTARKYFGSEDPIGKKIQGENGNYLVQAVVKDVPANSHFLFDMLIPHRVLEESGEMPWGPTNHCTYVKLRPASDRTVLEKKIQALVLQHKPQTLDTYFVQPLTDIHLHSKLSGELAVNGSAATLRIVSIIALFVMLVACINYINLATARAGGRAREIGIRKTVGALRQSVIGQFLTEAVLTAALAFALALVLCLVLLPAFNTLTGKQFSLLAPGMAGVWLSFGGLAVLIGLLAGLYPALYLSAFRPVEVLKGSSAQTSGSVGWVRSILVGLQFSISIALILGTIVVVRQMQYIHNTDPGFDQEQVLILPNARMLPGRQVLEAQIRQLPEVIEIGASTSIIGQPTWLGNIRKSISETDRMINFCQIDYHYLDALGMRLLAGRKFSPEFPADTFNTVILNEAAVRELQLDDPIGKQLIWDAAVLDTVIYAAVVGVVSDFHFSSFHEPIKPFAFLIRNHFFVQDDFTSKLFVKVRGNDLTGTIAAVEKLWQEFVPQRPFSYLYLEETFAQLHAAEQRFEVLFSCLTGLAIFIACLGLFALIAFVVQQRTKEIGIRKVLGASVTSIVLLLNKDLLKLIGIAMLVATPVAAYFLEQWLDGFAYRIRLEWWMIALAGLAALAVAFLSTGYQSVKASLMNPVESLKHE
ncbi:MAG: ABC transporter permease [Saprospiraceae bacterium]